ncbi:MAG: hypothetical protein GX115_04075 [Ruminiclostridium sp.]|jgi:hypothetical protein|nr:hypothetical protein [Ruminiclostridium sp.]
MVVYIIISLFAMYGFFHLLRDLVIKMKAGSRDCSGKLCLVPRPGDECLEGKIRCIFLDEISEKLGTDGHLYVTLEEDDPNKPMVEKLSFEYPRLVLMEPANWSRMNCRGVSMGAGTRKDR